MGCTQPYWGGGGNNVIIGANTLVSRDVPDNVVAVGNPVRVVRTLEEYYEKRKAAELQEAVTMVQEYIDRYGKEPPVEIMREHFWLFADDYDSLIPEFKDVMHLVDGSFEESCRRLLENKKEFEAFEHFIDYAVRVGKHDGEKNKTIKY